MYIIKVTKVPKGFMGKSILSDSEYKMLPENLKLYYRKYDEEEEGIEYIRLYPDSETNHNTF